MRRSVGTAMLWGAFGVPRFGIFLTPVFFSVVRWFTDRKKVEPAAQHTGPGGEYRRGTTLEDPAGSTPLRFLCEKRRRPIRKRPARSGGVLMTGINDR